MMFSSPAGIEKGLRDDCASLGGAPQFPAGMDSKTQECWLGKLATAAFGGLIGLLMRSPAHKHFMLPNLKWYPLPPLALGQFMVGETRLQNGQALPMALVPWARVSDEVDARLSAEVAKRRGLLDHRCRWGTECRAGVYRGADEDEVWGKTN